MKTSCACVVVAATAATLSGPRHAAAELIVFSSAADTYLRDSIPRGAFAFMDVRGGLIDFRGYLRFDLSGIPAGSIITGATLQLTQVPGASRNDNISSNRFATYGLDNAPGNTPQDWDEATFEPALRGAEDVTTLLGVTDLDDNVMGITEAIVGMAPASMISVSGAPLASFLQTRFDDGGLATFILSNDDEFDRGFGLGTKENTNPAVVPTLTVEYTIPGPTTLAILAVSSAGLMSRRRRPTDRPRAESES
jgi:hypothetical protein